MGWVTIASNSITKRKLCTSTPRIYFGSKSSDTNILVAYISLGYQTGGDKWAEVETSKKPGISSISDYRAEVSYYSYRLDKYGSQHNYRDKDGTIIGQIISELEDIDGSDIDATVRIQVYISPPSSPSYITVPSQVKVNEKFSITWASSSRSDYYELERSVDGGSYTRIYRGTSRSYSDTALDNWNTVRYRVRAGNDGGNSSYRESDIITIIPFPRLGLKINGVLKESDMVWVKVNGQLREIDSIYTKINGALKEAQ